MAFIFVEAVNGLGFSDYVIESVKPYMIGGNSRHYIHCCWTNVFCGNGFLGSNDIVFPNRRPIGRIF